jgi:hypothetical protein
MGLDPLTLEAGTLAMIWPRAEARALTGKVELDLAMAVAASRTRPQKVGAVIGALYATLDDQPVTQALVRRLSSGSRAWLLVQAAALVGRESGWFNASCADCGARFDFELSLADIPLGQAGPGFPRATVQTSLGERVFDVPNGGHEEHLAQARGDLARALVAVLGVGETAAADAMAFDAADLARIEAALDAAAPDIGDRVTLDCPDCGHANVIEIDPLEFAQVHSGHVLGDVHRIARAYGWREAAILALPSDRRRAYAGMCMSDRGRGSR